MKPAEEGAPTQSERPESADATAEEAGGRHKEKSTGNDGSGGRAEKATAFVSFDALFSINAAPILLIDPERGAIVDANPKAAEFYGYSREKLRTLHVWDINTLERSVVPVMREISSWAGGHHPQRFRHRRADGSLRDVQVYAGPVHLQGRRHLLCIIHDVTAVIEVELFNRLLLESVQVGVCGIDPDGNFTFVNPAAAHALGYRHDSELIRLNIGRFLAPDGETAAAPNHPASPHPVPPHPVLRVSGTGNPVHDLECALYRRDGSPFPARIVASPIRGAGGIVGAVVSFTDLTEEQERDARVTDLANALPGAVFQAEVHPDGRMRPTYFSAAARTLFGLPDDADPTSLSVLTRVMDRADRVGIRRGLLNAAQSGQAWEAVFRVGGTEQGKWLLGRAQPRTRPNGVVVFNGVLLDITERKRLEARLEQAAMNDPLTGVWNRRRLEQALEEAADRSARYDRPYSLALIDIDHFKRLNDTHGHHVGDDALCLVAATLAERSRRTDRLARWGGEEFALLLPETDITAALALASALLRAVAAVPIPVAGRVTVSIGVGQAVRGEGIQPFFQRVDAALYRAKAAGRNQVAPA